MERNPISKEGYEKKREEIRQLEEIEMPKIAQRIKEAREEGDLKENAEYHGARESQGMTQARINMLKEQLSYCYIVEASDIKKGVVGFGSVVTVKDLSDGMEEMYELVGPGDEDYEGEVMKILTSSPIASALMYKKVGDQVEAEVPSGTVRLEIVAVKDMEV